MSIDYSVSLAPRYVELTCRGVYGTEALLGAIRAALDIAEREGRRAVLIDTTELRAEAPLDTGERYWLGTSIAESQVGRSVRVAVVIVGKEPLLEPRRFAELVAINRGATGKSFTDHAEAVAWLEQAELG